MTPRLWTRAEWQVHVLNNCEDHYSLVVCAAALLLADHPQKEWDNKLRDNINGLTGFQAAAAKGIARHLPKGGWN